MIRAAGQQDAPTGALEAHLALATWSPNDRAFNRFTESKRVKQQRADAWVLIRHAFGTRPPPLPLRITLTLLHRTGRGVDMHDGAGRRGKHLVDELALWLGIDDADPRVTWAYAKQHDPRGGVRVRIEPRTDDAPPAGATAAPTPMERAGAAVVAAARAYRAAEAAEFDAIDACARARPTGHAGEARERCGCARAMARARAAGEALDAALRALDGEMMTTAGTTRAGATAPAQGRDPQ